MEPAVASQLLKALAMYSDDLHRERAKARFMPQGSYGDLVATAP